MKYTKKSKLLHLLVPIWFGVGLNLSACIQAKKAAPEIPDSTNRTRPLPVPMPSLPPVPPPKKPIPPNPQDISKEEDIHSINHIRGTWRAFHFSSEKDDFPTKFINGFEMTWKILADESTSQPNGDLTEILLIQKGLDACEVKIELPVQYCCPEMHKVFLLKKSARFTESPVGCFSSQQNWEKIFNNTYHFVYDKIEGADILVRLILEGPYSDDPDSKQNNFKNTIKLNKVVPE